MARRDRHFFDWKSSVSDLFLFRFRSIQVIITILISIITMVVVLVVSFMLYDKFSRTAEENAYLNIQQIIEQVSSNLGTYVKGMQDIYRVVEDQFDGKRTDNNSSLRGQLSTLLQTREDLVSIALFTMDGQSVINVPAHPMMDNTRLTSQSWFETSIRNPNKLSISAPHIQNLYQGQYKWVVSMSRVINYQAYGESQQGVLMVDINFRTIEELSSQVSLGKKGYAYITDSVGNIVYHPQQQLIYAGLKYENMEPVLKYNFGNYTDLSTGEERYITVRSVQPIGWKIVGVAYPSEIVTTKRDLGEFLIWFLAAVLACVIIISVFVSAKISQPILRLEKSVKKVERGDFSSPVDVKGFVEVERVSHRFNLMVQQIRELMEQIILEQEAKRKSELDVLQAQINPHFLYNTLNSVIRLAERGHNEEVVKTITSLSKLFRISLAKGNNIITVRDELEHVRNYLIIQNIRYKNKFQFVIQADNNVLDCQTLKLILQPLVENAIVHGLEEQYDPGMITIKAFMDHHVVRFTIVDNGLGMSPEKLKDVMSGESEGGKGSGVGVKNVNERIRLAYGPEYGLHYESEREEGTTVTVTIPAQWSEDVPERRLTS